MHSQLYITQGVENIVLATNIAMAKRYLDEAAKHIKEADGASPEVIAELIAACRGIDEHYKEMCAEADDRYGDPDGTTYRDGISIEFYIEADWWHDVSLALRKLTPSK